MTPCCNLDTPIYLPHPSRNTHSYRSFPFLQAVLQYESSTAGESFSYTDMNDVTIIWLLHDCKQKRQIPLRNSKTYRDIEKRNNSTKKSFFCHHLLTLILFRLHVFFLLFFIQYADLYCQAWRIMPKNNHKSTAKLIHTTSALFSNLSQMIVL